MEDIKRELREIKSMLQSLQDQVGGFGTHTARNFETLEKRLKSKIDDIETTFINKINQLKK